MNPTDFVATSSVDLRASLTVGMAPPPWPYLGAARDLARGLKPLATPGHETLAALTFVAAQVVECALKAYLSRSGDDARLKKRAIRHSLTDLWLLSVSEGLPLSPTPPNWLGVLSAMHNEPYAIRYPVNSFQFLPAAEPMVTNILDMVSLVEATLRDP